MKPWQKVATFVVALLVVLGVAIAIGRLVGPIDTDEEAHDAEHGSDRMHLEPAGEGDGPDHGSHGHSGAAFELALERAVLDEGRQEVAFRILDDAGDPVTSYDVQHQKRLHLIAVRSDLARYRHVHPRLEAATGRWTVPLALEPGSWRLYADFAPAGAEPTVAEADLMVGGSFAPEELAANSVTARVAGYEVHLTQDPSTSTLALHVTRGGAEVTDLQPYLGAYGHLVAIRATDLGYLHVHPEDGPPGPEVAFHAELDQPGRYRLFFDFKHRGRVLTADFTTTVGDGAAEEEGSGEHDDHEEEGGGGHDH